MSGNPTWVPHDSATLNTVFANGYLPTFRISPAGLAGGNHVLEASAHALCELIEHDAAVEWRTNRDLRQIDLSEIQDPQCALTLDKLYRAGVRVVAWDMTNAIGIPAVAAAILEKPYLSNWRSLGVAYGCGCHLSPSIALMRAINEAVQTRLTYIAASRDDLYDEDYARNRNLDYTLQVWEETARPTSFSPFHLLPDASTNTFEGDIDLLLGALRRAGIESVMAVDLTKPEIGIPVVKMVAPGLRQSVRECEPVEVAA
jgi:ribosomal protein S12 methylthiotransferase accessory factor